MKICHRMITLIYNRLAQSLRYQKLSRDIAYTLGSFFVLAISGIVINIVIMGFRDAAALGVFNLAYAVYIMLSQFAVWGLHYSVLRYAAYYESDPEERGHMLLTATACSVATGLIAAIGLFMAAPWFAKAFNSEATGAAIRNAALGLALFPLNKVLIAYLNGLRRMKAFAVLQASRYVAVMILVSAIAVSTLPIEFVTFGFLVAEILTVLLACSYIINRRLTGALRFTPGWIARHYRFGARVLPAGMFAEINSRIDVLMIGFFLSDRATGIYSFAAMLVDGAYHVLAMVRLNFNPVLVAAIRDADWRTAQNLRYQSRRIVLPVMALLALGLMSAYYVFAAWVMPPDKGLLEGLPSLVILLLGLSLICFLVPFDNLLMVSGYPGYQTLQQLFLVGTNVGVALLLLPMLGIEGAALGTAASYITGVLAAAFFANRLLGWNLLNNRVRHGNHIHHRLPVK